MSFSFSDILSNLGGLKEQMEEVHRRLEAMRITGEAGAGMVQVTLSGDGKIKGIHIDNNLLSEKEKDVVEELIISAFTEAQKKTREAINHEMKSIIGNVSIPGLERFFGI